MSEQRTAKPCDSHTEMHADNGTWAGDVWQCRECGIRLRVAPAVETDDPRLPRFYTTTKCSQIDQRPEQEQCRLSDDGGQQADKSAARSGASAHRTSKQITRADIVLCDGESGRCRAHLEPCIAGDWVLYVDHRAEIERLERVIQQVAANIAGSPATIVAWSAQVGAAMRKWDALYQKRPQ